MHDLINFSSFSHGIQKGKHKDKYFSLLITILYYFAIEIISVRNQAKFYFLHLKNIYVYIKNTSTYTYCIYDIYYFFTVNIYTNIIFSYIVFNVTTHNYNFVLENNLKRKYT